DLREAYADGAPIDLQIDALQKFTDKDNMTQYRVIATAHVSAFQLATGCSALTMRLLTLAKVTITSPSDQKLSGCMTIEYSVAQADSAPATLSVEYSENGREFLQAEGSPLVDVAT